MTKFCPLMQIECVGVDCAWMMREGDCVISMLGNIQDRLEEIDSCLRSARDM